MQGAPPIPWDPRTPHPTLDPDSRTPVTLETHSPTPDPPDMTWSRDHVMGALRLYADEAFLLKFFWKLMTAHVKNCLSQTCIFVEMFWVLVFIFCKFWQICINWYSWGVSNRLWLCWLKMLNEPNLCWPQQLIKWMTPNWRGCVCNFTCNYRPLNVWKFDLVLMTL